MVRGDRSREEAEIRSLAARGDYDAAMSRAVERYGPELVGFLTVLLRDEDLAREVFGQLSERLWKALPSFEWRSSFRTWAYRAARNAGLRTLEQRARHRSLATEDGERLEAAPPRTSTAPFRRTENKAHLRRLRASLSADEQALLTLRIDRAMTWSEIAEVWSEETSGRAARRGAEARLRKRFERVVGRLRQAAMAEGWVPAT